MAGLLDSVPGMSSWKESSRVWDFQQRFGVKKVEVIEKQKGGAYQVRVNHSFLVLLF